MNINDILKENVLNRTLIYCVFTGCYNLDEHAENSDAKYKKIIVKPISNKKGLFYQLEKFTEKQAFHENVTEEEICDRLKNLAINHKNGNLFTKSADYQLLVKKNGEIRIVKNKPTKTMQISSHNKQKSYILPEYTPCDFLIELGIMNEKGKVFAQKYDKFKQINKFLEIVEDAMKKSVDSEKYSNENYFKIIDFGCGKAYLTFALYHYFYNVKKIKTEIIGLDLKEDVINFCNKTAQKLKYDKLKFEIGDIKDYVTDLRVDMVVTLHACDNATDAALIKSVGWGADIILSVPCCQHEFFSKINNENLQPMLRHGLIKERLSSLVTDSLRNLYLEKNSYKVQIVEFVDLEHTPKNMMIRAIKQDYSEKQLSASSDEYNEFKEFWNLKDLFLDNES